MTNIQLAEFCRKTLDVPTMYLWGTYGRVITKSLLDSKVKQYPNRYSATRQAFIKKRIDGLTRGCDCVGLIKWAMWTQGNMDKTPAYSSKTDRNCSGLYKAATEKGPIAVMPEQEGIVVYKEGHVGVYIGKGEVVECTLGIRGDGCVKTKLQDAGWTHWLRVPEIEYIAPQVGTPKKQTYASKQKILEKLSLIKRRIDEEV